MHNVNVHCYQNVNVHYYQKGYIVHVKLLHSLFILISKILIFLHLLKNKKAFRLSSSRHYYF